MLKRNCYVMHYLSLQNLDCSAASGRGEKVKLIIYNY